MTEQEAHDAFDEAKVRFDATVAKLRGSGINGRKLYDHQDYTEASEAKWAAFDVWTKIVAEGR